MKRSWFSILIIAGLLGLLGVLATLQYQWLGKISDDERERIHKRLENDTQRFAEDFNRDIQSAYFSLQLDAEVWRGKNYTLFNQRLNTWRANTKFPALIKNIYFAGGDEFLQYDFENKTFNAAVWTEELKSRQAQLADNNFDTVDEKSLLLAMPIYEEIKRLRVVEGENPPLPKIPEKFGHLFIKLDEQTIKNQIFPELANKYFSGGSNADFLVTVVSQQNPSEVIFGSQPTDEISGQNADASAPLLNLAPDNLAVFVSRELLSTVRGERRQQSNVVISRTTGNHQRDGELKVPVQGENRVNVFKYQRSGDANPSIIEQPTKSAIGGKWILNVRHVDGSLENFITKAKRRNLAVSFGILSLLAVSIILIFVSSQRAKMLAQKQMDFVSAVSHEFRTPLAVIYSASENLTDGVVQNERQVSQYGNLIKREGRKLSAMVEQILEFAGARSGKRKYDFRLISVESVIENALVECESILNEKNFTVEKEIASNLPPISADEKALSQAIQNLIANAVKYGNNNSWLKISAKNGNSQIKIQVEDRGIGISSKDMRSVFDPFFRAKSVVDAQIYGNGLGLSLVKQTVEAHEGKIAVESELEKGSKFTIQLPTVAG